jgi:hypothetical protein
MDLFFEDPDNPGHGKNKTCNEGDFKPQGTTDTTVQLVISLLLGLSAFFAFCVSLAPSAVQSPLLQLLTNLLYHRLSDQNGSHYTQRESGA